MCQKEIGLKSLVARISVETTSLIPQRNINSSFILFDVLKFLFLLHKNFHFMFNSSHIETKKMLTKIPKTPSKTMLYI